MIPEQELKRFQELYQLQFGEFIDLEEAQDKAVKLLELVRLVYRPIPTGAKINPT